MQESGSELVLAKARESLAGALSEFSQGRYNNCANRAYYACFQAAIGALIGAGIAPAGAQWGHDFVQAQFIGQLINRRKLFPTSLRETLLRALALRQVGDYSMSKVNETQASRMVLRAQEFVVVIDRSFGQR